MLNLIRNLSDNTRIYVYAFSYVAAFMLFIGVLTLIVDVIQTYSSDPEFVLMGGVIIFFIYMIVSFAISSAKSKVRDEVRREREIINKMSDV
jgi:ABC-type multidrug transport system fused ATPase/permease subunit